MRAVRRMLVVLVVLVAGLLVVLPRLGPAPDPSKLPPRDRAVAVADGVELNVRELGAGAPVVLVHGLPSNIGDWADTPERLAARGHHVVVYDRAGYGWSSRPPATGDAYSLASNARELGALLDRLGIERAALVGWSYGGGIVQTFAAEHPDRVSHLVLIASVGPAFPDAATDWIGRVGRSPLGPPLFRWVVATPAIGRGVLEDGLRNVFSGDVPPGFAERAAAQMAMPGTVDAWLAEERGTAYAKLRPESIAAPTLVLQGTNDRSVPVAIAEDLARRLPNARLERIEGGSHMLPVTHAVRVAARIHEWVADR